MKAVRAHLATVPRNVEFTDTFLGELLARHPEKKARGHVALYFGKSPLNPFVRSDGTRDTVACVRASPTHTPATALSHAMRTAIYSTARKAFRDANPRGMSGRERAGSRPQDRPVRADQARLPGTRGRYIDQEGRGLVPDKG